MTSSLQSSIAADETTQIKHKPVFDPLGLYPQNAPERTNGRMKPLFEDSDVITRESMTDRLGIYELRDIDEVELKTNNKAIYDPLRLYSETSEERRNKLIKPLEESNTDRNKVIFDPLRIYPSQIITDEDTDKSDSLPFLPRPSLLDRSMPGDVGFDPFNFGGNDS